MNKNSWTIILEEDENSDVIIPFPPELIKKYGWLEGDELELDIVTGGASITNISAKMRENDIG